jgi:Spy/CpxP family protein refolding chaperone
MKTLYLALLIFLGLPGLGYSQQDESGNINDRKKIQAMEVAYITKELDLTPEEAQKFWPVFNKYRDDVKGVLTDKNISDQLEKQQKVLDLRKKYRTDFTRILTQERANKVFSSEDQFRQMVRREFQKRQMERRQINPGKRGG